MATMNVSLPDAMKDWVEAQVATGRYANVSDFIRDILRDAMDREVAQEEFDRLVAEGEESGESDRSFEEIIDAAKQRRAGDPDAGRLAGE